MAALMCQCPVCREAAEIARRDREEREMLLVALAYVSDRYRLDDTDALQHVRLHGAAGTGVMQ